MGGSRRREVSWSLPGQRYNGQIMVSLCWGKNMRRLRYDKDGNRSGVTGLLNRFIAQILAGSRESKNEPIVYKYS